MASYSPLDPTIQLLLALACLGIVLQTWYHGGFLTLLNDLVSFIVDIYLRARNPIINLSTGTPIPTVPYRFPNGQGNVAKFLEGRERRAEWAESYGGNEDGTVESGNEGSREGGGMYRIWNGTQGEIVLSNAEHVASVFRDSHNHIKSISSNSGQLMHQLLGQCLGDVSGSRWRKIKSVTEKPFLRLSVLQYTSLISEMTFEYLNGLEVDKGNDYMANLPSLESKIAEGIIHPVSDLKFLPFLILARIIYGPLPVELLDQLISLTPIREAVFKQIITGGVSRFWISQYLPLAANKLLWEYKTRWAAFNSSARSHAATVSIEKTANKEETTTTQATSVPILEWYNSMDRGEISKEELLQTLDEILWANLDVTMGGLSWTLVYLAASQSAQSKLRDEIIFMRNQPSNDNDNDTHASDTSPELTFSEYLSSKSSTYLASCISEAARLRPFAAFSLPQAAPSPRVLSNYLVPAGTNFIVDSYALNVEDPIWGPDKKEFRPERWQELEQKGEKGGSGTRYIYWRFGFGPRQCMGKYIADLILRQAVVEILGRWRLEIDGEDEGRADLWSGDAEAWVHNPTIQLRCVRLG